MRKTMLFSALAGLFGLVGLAVGASAQDQVPDKANAPAGIHETASPQAVDAAPPAGKIAANRSGDVKPGREDRDEGRYEGRHKSRHESRRQLSGEDDRAGDHVRDHDHDRDGKRGDKLGDRAGDKAGETPVRSRQFADRDRDRDHDRGEGWAHHRR